MFLFIIPVFPVPASLIVTRAHFLTSRPVLNRYHIDEYFPTCLHFGRFYKQNNWFFEVTSLQRKCSANVNDDTEQE